MASKVADTAIHRYWFKSYVPQLKRLLICHNNIRMPEGIREYMRENLEDFAMSNPSTAVYCVPVAGANFMIAQYLNGFEKQVDISRMNYKEIGQLFELLRSNSGHDWKKKPFRKNAMYHKNSMQGIWSNQIHKNTNLKIVKDLEN